MVWWDCSKCFHRVMDISLKKAEETRYYAVPPCPISPNFNPSIPVPPVKVKKEVRPATPPLNTAQYRTQKSQETFGYTAEENTILKEARKILQQKGLDTSGFPTTNTGASGSMGPMMYPTVNQGQVSGLHSAAKRAGPALFQFGQGPTAMKAEDELHEGFTVVDPNLDNLKDAEILEELQRLEEKTNLLKLTLQKRAS